jgi:cellulose synthase/poly-beta-1,6-N-acetylglucosamine synthase-like glycosyltransferase
MARPEGKSAVVVIPAHNEERGIGPTLAALKVELSAVDSVLVVADNCTDDTAAVARRAGATVIERSNAEERGKGYALDFAVRYLDAQPIAPDVVIILDADCRFAEGSVDALVTSVVALDTPVQAEYELATPPEADSKARVGAFAFRVKNTLRTRGLARLGLPRQLAGTGMAFPWTVLRNAPNTKGHITEDLVMGLQLAMLGKPAFGCPEAAVTSEIAPSSQGQAEQRRRWEGGHLSAIREYAPKLLSAALGQRRLDLLAIACDLAVPPLSLLVVSVAGLSGAAVTWWAVGGSWLPAVLFGGEMMILVVAVGAAWRAVGRDILPGRELVAIPKYLLWKVPGYLARRRDAGWVRAERR